MCKGDESSRLFWGHRASTNVLHHEESGFAASPLHAISVFLLFSHPPNGRSIQLNFGAILPVPARVDWKIFTCLLSLVRSFLHKCIYI